MKKTLALAILCCLLLPATAQRVKAKWGSSTPISRKSYLKEIIGISNGFLYALRSEQAGFLGPYQLFFEAYSLEGLKLAKNTPLVMPRENGNETKFQKLIATRNKLFLFTTGYNKQKKEKTAYGYTIDANGKPTESKEVDKITEALSHKDGVFDFVLTQDSSHILAYHNKPFAKKNNEKFSYALLDLSLNQVWKKSIEIPYPDKEVSIKNYFGDKQGNIYMLAKVEEPATKEDASFKYIVLAYYAATNELKEYEISLPQRAITQIKMSLLPTGDIAVAGFFSNRPKDNDKMAGTFFVKINSEAQAIAASSFNDFKVEFLELFLTEKQAEKGKELESLVMDDIVLHPSGNFLLVAEQYYKKQICITDPRTGMLDCTDHYYYNDIVAISLNASGNVLWSKRIPKRQYSSNSQNPYFSYLFGVGEETAHFVFLDNPKNLEIEENGSCKHTTNAARSALMNVTLREDGTQTKNILFDVRDKQTTIVPGVAYRIDNSHYVVYSEGRKSGKMGELVFE